MNVEVSPVSVQELLPSAEDLSPLKNPRDAGDEEDEVFYDAGEEITDNSSDIALSEIMFSVANEDLPTDISDRSEIDLPRPLTPHPRNIMEPLPENLDDISTEDDSSVERNNFPLLPSKTLTLYDDDDDVPEGDSPKRVVCGEKQNTVASNEIEKTSIGEPAHNGGVGNTTSENESSEKNYVIVSNSKSSMEVMDDDSDENFCKGSLVTERSTVSENTVDEFSSVGDETAESGLRARSTENVCDESSKTPEPICSATLEVGEKNPDVGDILTMDDDSDVDQSFQDNLQVALKVVEESSLLSPAKTDSKTEEIDSQQEKTDESMNRIDDVVKQIEPISNTESILQEFHDDAAQINSGDTETIDERLCPCKVVLFRVDFDKNVLQCRGTDADTLPSTDNSDSDEDSSFSRSVRTNRKSRFRRPRSVKKAIAKKIVISSSESEKEIPRLSARSSRITPLNSEPSVYVASARPRKKLLRATNSNSSKSARVRSSSSDSDNLPLNQVAGSRKRTASKRGQYSTLNAKKLPHKIKIAKIETNAKRLPSKKNEDDDKRSPNPKINQSFDVSSSKTLRCVSLPIITGVIKSLKQNSYEELLELMGKKGNKQSRTEKTSQLEEIVPVGRRFRRRKLSQSALSKSTADDEDEYKVYSKAWKYDSGSPKEKPSSSLRAKLNSSPVKKSLREKTKTLCYNEDSKSSDEDECVLKRIRKTKRNFNQIERNSEEVADGSGSEAEHLLSEIDKRYPRRRIAQSTSRTRT